jgi:hypothetical protein
MKVYLVFCLGFLSVLFGNVYAQENIRLSATLIDADTQEPLAFATAFQPATKIGTITDEDGKFTLIFPKENLQDSITISFIGYKTTSLTAKQIEAQVFSIELDPLVESLSAIVLSPNPPIYFIRKMIEEFPNTMSLSDFSAIQSYHEKLYENKQLLSETKALFGTNFIDKTHKDSILPTQIYLHKLVDKSKNMVFKKKRLEKEEKKWKKKAAKDKTTNMDSLDRTPFLELSNILGGIHQSNYYLNTKDWKIWSDTSKLAKLNFEFGKEKYVYQDSIELVRIVQVSKGGSLEFLIRTDNYALYDFKIYSRMKIPFYLKPILFASGIKIGKNNFYMQAIFREIKGRMYPSYTVSELKARVEERKWFAENKVSNFLSKQITVVKKIKENKLLPIQVKNIYRRNKPMAEQTYNTEGFSWKDFY